MKQSSKHKVNIGVLALQGDFGLHAKMLDAAGAGVVEVREPGDLKKIRGLVIPGGETTTLDRLLRSSGLDEAISNRYRDGSLPIFGTCMGMILLGGEIVGYPELFRFGFMDMAVERNAYGRQVDSFEADVKIRGMKGKPFRAVFIRAPKVASLGKKARVLASHAGLPVMMTQGNCLAASFHPELTDDSRAHSFFIERFVNR